jgi:hypothetical protein
LTAEAQQVPEAPSPRLAQRVALALEDAAEDDPDFGTALEELVRQLQEAERRSGPVTATAGGVAIGGNVSVHAEGGSFAAGVVSGDVSFGNPPASGTGSS